MIKACVCRRTAVGRAGAADPRSGEEKWRTTKKAAWAARRPIACAGGLARLGTWLAAGNERWGCSSHPAALDEPHSDDVAGSVGVLDSGVATARRLARPRVSLAAAGTPDGRTCENPANSAVTRMAAACRTCTRTLVSRQERQANRGVCGHPAGRLCMQRSLQRLAAPGPSSSISCCPAGCPAAAGQARQAQAHQHGEGPGPCELGT